MASYQEIDSAVKQLDRKLNFVMNAIRVAQQSAIVGAPPRVLSLLDLYQESQTAGLTIDTTAAEK